MDMLPNLRAHWRLNEGSATVPVEVHAGKVVSVVGSQPGSFAGQIGLARGLFTTANRYTIIPSGDADFDIRGNTSMSCTFWVYHTLEGATQSAIEIWSGAVEDQGFLVRYESAFDKWIFHISLTGTTGTPPTVAVNTWNFVGVSYDEALDKQRIYVNGTMTEITNTGGFTHTSIIAPAHWKMGGVTSTGLDGYLDSLSWWKDRALTKNEFDFMYRSGRGRDYPFGSDALQVRHFWKGD